MERNFEVVDFIHMADFLEENAQPEKIEVFLRTAIGRIYYSIYLTLLKKAKTNRIVRYTKIRDVGDHQNLIDYFRNYYNPQNPDNISLKIADNLELLRDLRIKADYKPDEKIIEKDLKMAWNLLENTQMRIQNTIWSFELKIY